MNFSEIREEMFTKMADISADSAIVGKLYTLIHNVHGSLDVEKLRKYAERNRVLYMELVIDDTKEHEPYFAAKHVEEYAVYDHLIQLIDNCLQEQVVKPNKSK